MKRSSLLVLPLLLAACGGSSDTATCDQAYWDGTVGTCLPDEWIVVERDALDARGVPNEVIAAFQSEKPFSGQYPTVTVTREALTDETDSPTYSDASMDSVRNLPGYEELDARTIEIDGEDVTLHVFSAQPRPEDPKARFYQVSFSAGKAGYTFTAAVPLAINDQTEDELLLIMENATAEAPADEEAAEDEEA